MDEKVIESFNLLEEYCKQEEFKGYDPYDGLNSSVFNSLPFLSHSRIVRLIWIQFFKRSPLNFRRLVGINKGYNPKAMGLFLSGYCNLYRIDPNPKTLEYIYFFIDKILDSRLKGYSGDCWGYNFDWQAKAFFQPKGTPTVVATTFISSALLDAYEVTKDNGWLDSARSSCNFILNDLNRTYDRDEDFAFSYSPLDKTVVFNASMLGSRLLSRVYGFTNEIDLIREAKKSISFCCKHQKNDGSWDYGLLDFHQWIDSFHTGYNLECLYSFIKYSGEKEFEHNLNNGLNYYVNHFFESNGTPKYYNNSIYPIDVHAPAQLIITLTKLGRALEYKELLETVLYWAIENMQSQKGFFYFQKKRCFLNRIPYMRWAQAWMFYSLSNYLHYGSPHEKNEN